MQSGRNNEITIVSMSNEDSSYPKENLLKKDTGIRAKTTGQTTTIVATADRIRDIFLFKPIADEGNITVLSGATEVYNRDIDFSIPRSESAWWNGELSYRNAYWVELDTTYPNLTITITLTSNSASRIVELGFLAAYTITKIGEGSIGIDTKSLNNNKYNAGQLLRTQAFSVGYGADKEYEITSKPEDYYYLQNSISENDFGVVVNRRSDHFIDETIRLGYLDIKNGKLTSSKRMKFNLLVRSS